MAPVTSEYGKSPIWRLGCAAASSDELELLPFHLRMPVGVWKRVAGMPYGLPLTRVCPLMPSSAWMPRHSTTR